MNANETEAIREKVYRRNSIIFRARYHRSLISKVLKLLPPQSDRILDIGCGYGNMTKFLEEKGNTVIGVDLEGVFYHPYVSEKLSFLKSDALHIPFNDNTFDGLISLDVIEHVPDDKRFADEVRRVLKPSGLAIIETPNRNRLSVELRSVFKSEIKNFPRNYGHDELLGDIIHIREYTKPELEKLFESFKKVTVSGHWCGLTSPEIGVETPWRRMENLSQSWILTATK
jgi:ubiquinone/menaquinone biosynthesis C-methylase UbiE